MKTLLTIAVNVFLWIICWLMTLLACARIGNISWQVLKSCHTIMTGYEQVFWDYLNDKITEEEHSQKLQMYLLEI